ncbi:MAG: hypothetical protein EBU88_00415 [Acidobacteria bacterium]|nr:hypothetical protein [Acidobacteriota bacterium]
MVCGVCRCLISLPSGV